MNVMMYYIVYVFGMAGLTGNTNLIASSIQYVINVGMTIFALLYIDRWGRRIPLLVGATLMGTWMFGNAGLLATYGKPAPPGGIDGIAEQSWQIGGAPARAVIAFTYLFVASFAPTWGPVSWVSFCWIPALRRLLTMHRSTLPSCSLSECEAKPLH